MFTRKIKWLMSIALVVWLLFFALNTFAQTPVKNIVLVHGAFADGSGWEAVYKILKKKGYQVSVVGNPNTGMPEDVAATSLVLKGNKDRFYWLATLTGVQLLPKLVAPEM